MRLNSRGRGEGSKAVRASFSPSSSSFIPDSSSFTPCEDLRNTTMTSYSLNEPRRPCLLFSNDIAHYSEYYDTVLIGVTPDVSDTSF